jgi:hypothetical protein
MYDTAAIALDLVLLAHPLEERSLVADREQQAAVHANSRHAQ